MTPAEYMDSTLDFVHTQLGLPKPTWSDKALCRIQASIIEALVEIEQGKANDAHKTLSDALREAA